VLRSHRRGIGFVNPLIAKLGLSLVLLVLPVPGLLLPATSHAAVDVVGDGERERYVGSGAVLLPSNLSSSTRHEASRCAGCRWKVTLPCRLEEIDGDAVCRGTILGCPQGREISRVWLARPGGDFEAVGMFCPSDGEVTSVDDATRQVRAGFERHIPPLAIQCQPPRGVVVGIPLHCRSKQSTARVTWTDRVAGYTVETRTQARWEWTFTQVGRSASQNSVWRHHADFPGESYPAAGIRQSFTASGVHRVDVLARWTGEFTVDGLGPFSISPDLLQRASLQVPTGSALGVVRG
jgi:hypothetical protein